MPVLRLLRLLFLSTPSARRATIRHDHTYQQGLISIHALRAEGDVSVFFAVVDSVYFYPRPPRGGRQTSNVAYIGANLFLSTPSARRATASRDVQSRDLVISIHALREEGDC